MTKVTRLLLILILLLSLGLPSLAFQRGNEVINIPSARAEFPGYLEVGGGISGAYVSSNISTVTDLFVRAALSDHFEYGLTAVGNTILHHLELYYDPLGTEKQSFHMAIGMKNIGWTPSTNPTVSTVFGAFLAFSFQLREKGAWIHAGIAESRNKGTGAAFLGTEFETFIGSLAIEWDGELYSVGLRNIYADNVALTIAMQSNFKPINQSQNRDQIRIGVSLMDPSPLILKREKEKGEKAQIASLNARLASANTIAQSLASQNRQASLNFTQKLKSMTPSNDPEILRRSVLAMQQGNYFYYQGRFQEALTEYLEFIRLNPKLASGYIAAGSIYKQLGLNEDALHCWKKALDIDPQNSSLRAYIKKNRIQGLLEDEDPRTTPTLTPGRPPVAPPPPQRPTPQDLPL